ncbi:MAG: hypothetical protein JXR35_11765 [Rhodobacteraceae bacterium]|nr:hypothetical protein [Paracoccaceae bacterium]
MELIVGNKRVTPEALREIPGGIEADLTGEALTSLIDATFRGYASIEMLGGDLDRQRMDVIDIRMAGDATTVTLRCHGAMALH